MSIHIPDKVLLARRLRCSWDLAVDGVGFRLIISFITKQGSESIRMQTELSLAHAIQSTLVPTIWFENKSFEAFGRSIPRWEMRGDIIDVVESEGCLLAYLVDVSGNGLPASQLMGMLKTAMRLSLQFHQRPSVLLEAATKYCRP